MYSLSQPISSVKGVGKVLTRTFHQAEIFTVNDLLQWIPYRYEDRTQTLQLTEVLKNPQINEFITLQAKVEKCSQFFTRGRSVQTATLVDESGQKITANWFNQKFILQTLRDKKTFFFSGKLVKNKGRLILTQPTVEKLSDNPTHSQRLVPIYSKINAIPPRKLRSLLKHIVDNLQHEENDPVHTFAQKHQLAKTVPLSEAFRQIHFPDQEENIVKAHNRFALEELIELIQHSIRIKNTWRDHSTNYSIVGEPNTIQSFIPDNLPFSLTNSQLSVLQDIAQDLTQHTAMNRLLVGDVGSGKTIVALIAMAAIVDAGYHACLIAPTQLVAQQHFQTAQQLFPDIRSKLVTADQKLTVKNFSSAEPSFFIGTHAVINLFRKYPTAPIGLIVYDEQHRFGVSQRSQIKNLKTQPHVLTMTATPIPRSLMLTIFSHLSLSQITELPANRIPTKTRIIASSQKSQMWKWIAEKAADNDQFLTLYVCPFIDPSHASALENVKAATDMFQDIQKHQAIQHLNVELLHGRLSKTAKQSLLKKLYANQIDLLITTPIVEVGVDLPQASVMIIENPERFGLASLHQLRGRVGRAGQQGYCFLVANYSKNTPTYRRLRQFCQIQQGQKLAQLDLQNRGAGNLFGTQQKGFDQLKYVNWSDLAVISTAKKFIDNRANATDYQPHFHTLQSSQTDFAAN